MAKSRNKVVAPTTTASQLTMLFIMTAAFGMIVMFLANLFVPQNVVLGNHIFSPGLALVYSMVTFSLLSVGMAPVIEWVAAKRKLVLTNSMWMAVYLVVNFVALWIVSRFAELLGLGISSWRVIFVLALIIDVLQGSAMEIVAAKTGKTK